MTLPLKSLKKGPKLTDIFLKIPICGLENLLLSKNHVEKSFWIVVLACSVVTTALYTLPLVKLFVRSKTVVDFSIAYPDQVPFPFIYVCVIGSSNKTYLHELLRVEETVKEMIDSQRGLTYRLFKQPGAFSMQKFLDEFMAYFASSPTQAPEFHRGFVPAFNELITKEVEKLGDQWPGYKAFYEEGMFPCQSVVTDCAFNGVTFPCCREDTTANFEDNICYGLTPSSAFSDGVSQSMDGWNAGLTFNTAIDMDHVFDHLKESAGIRIHVGQDLSLFDLPATVPVDTVGYIRLKAKRRVLLNDCWNKYKFDATSNEHPLLIEYKRSLATTGQYSPKKCVMAAILDSLYKTCGCLVHHDRTIRPNDSLICTPTQFYACVYGGTTGEVEFDDGEGSRADVYKSIKRRIENHCLPVCDTWQYDTQAMFTVLPQPGNGTNLLRNQFLINFASIEYRQEIDVPQLSILEFIAGIGANLGLILGLSAVGLVQAAVWCLTAATVMRNKKVGSGEEVP